MPIELDYPEAKALLNRAVAEKGADYVYPADRSCTYFDAGTDQPACIVGHLLSYKGVTAAGL